MALVRLVRGIGVNDADYPIQQWEVETKRDTRGKLKYRIVWRCPFYVKWDSMLRRCYSPKELIRHPTYKDCTVCEEWLLFSNFRKWMISQDWKGKSLDKDLLVEGNKVYSPETCIFIDRKINSFTVDRGEFRGKCLLGCLLVKNTGTFTAKCSDPFNKRGRYLGVFSTELEAHFAWKKQKYLYACELADSEYVTDERVRQILLNRYKNYTTLEDHLK